MGRIGLGASLGGVAGGVLAWSAAGLLPVPAMLLVMAVFNVVCLLALTRLRASASGDAGKGAGSGGGTGPLSGFRLLGEVPYLRDLALIVALGAATEALLDYLLNAQAAAVFPRGQPLMSFFAMFHTGVGLLALAAQMTLSRPSLRSLGLAGTVALRPAAVAAGALLGLVDPRLWSALLARSAHGVLHNSLFRSGYELLYTPLPDHRKRPTKTIVDVGFDRLGTVAGGLLLITTLDAGTWSTADVLYVYRARWQVELVFKKMKQLLRLNQIRSKHRTSVEATVRALLIAWALQESTTTWLRTLLSATASPASVVVSSWLLSGLGLDTLRQQVQGRWSEARLQACLPRLHRFLCSRPRRRGHQESTVRTWLDQRACAHSGRRQKAA